VSAANTHDGPGAAHDAAKPAKLHADNAYDIAHLRTWLPDRNIAVRIARKGIESGEKFGKHCGDIEGSIA
jgi:hypothetical protein